MPRRRLRILAGMTIMALVLAPLPAQGQTVLERVRLGNNIEGLTYVDNGPNAGHAVMIDGYEVRGLPATGKGGAKAPARTLFDLRELDVGGVPRGIAWVSSEKRFAIADPTDIGNLIFTDHRGRRAERREISYPEDPHFEPYHFEGLAYIPQDAAVYPDHLALVVLGDDSTPGNPCAPSPCAYATRVMLLTLSGEVVLEIFPGGETSDLRWHYGLGLAFLAPDQLLLHDLWNQEMNVLAFDGTVVEGPFSTAPVDYEGLVQIPGRRIVAADINAGHLYFFDEELNPLPDSQRDVRLGPGVTGLFGVAWDGDAGQFLVSQIRPSGRVVALSASLETATPIAQVEAPYLRPRGTAYIPAADPAPPACTSGGGLVAVTNVLYRVFPDAFRGPILLYDKTTGELCHEIDVHILDIGTPRQPEYLPSTGQLALRFSSNQQALQLLSLDGVWEGVIDLETAVGSDSIAVVAASFPCAADECLLVYDWPDTQLVVTDLDGTALGPVIDLEGDLDLPDLQDLAYISSGRWAGAFAASEFDNNELVIFSLD